MSLAVVVIFPTEIKIYITDFETRTCYVANGLRIESSRRHNLLRPPFFCY